MKHTSQIGMIVIGLTVGVLFTMQARTYTDITTLYQRENKVNIFREIQVLKDSNDSLRDESNSIKEQLAKGFNKEEALKNIKAEIEKNMIIAGDVDVKGEGIKLILDGNIPSFWFVDITNEMFSTGAEAVSINGQKLADWNIGFDTLPNGQILVGENILSAPYTFEAIGNKKILLETLKQSGGILNRLRDNLPKVKFSIEAYNDITITKAVA